MAIVLVPLPERDFDPTEVAVSWRVLTAAGHQVRFATPSGRPAAGDDLMLTGRGLDPWGWIPGLRRLVVVGRVLRADRNARDAYAEMVRSAEFADPARWDDVELSGVDGLLLAGGHRARGMGEYLQSSRVQSMVVEAFDRGRPVAAVCHGVLLAARSRDPASGLSVLHGRRTTALTWSLERKAWHVARLTRFWDPGYYRTYADGPGQPAGYMSVQAEVTRALARPEDFCDVDPSAPDARRKGSGRYRDETGDERPALVVVDGNYVSARWPGDVHTFAHRFAGVLDAAAGPGRHAPATAPSERT